MTLTLGDRPLPFEVWPRRAARSLLLLLLATPGHRLARDRAVDLLWPELPTDRARDTWYQTLSSLRRMLEPDLGPRQASAYLTVDPSSIAILKTVALWTDIDAFEDLLHRTADDLPQVRRASLRTALALYQGDLLAEEPAADWASARRADLRRDWQRAAIQLAALDLQAGEPLASVSDLQAVVAADRTSEAAHRALIGAYIAAGERDKALHQYELCRQALHDDLGVAPAEPTQQLVTERGAALLSPAPISAINLAPQRLPPIPATPFIGRDREVSQLEDLLWRPDVRLVTLTGPGGIGKTRLAMEVVRHVAQEDKRVVFVPLAAVRSPGLALSAIGQALGARPESGTSLLSTVLRRIAQHELLLLLDNFEHVAAAADLVSQLLATCPRLTVLVTSRTPLHIDGEHVAPVPPLSLPGSSHSSLDSLARSDAVALFIERAAAARAGFALTAENAEAVALLCSRLDGLPLAIELAAARVRVLSPRAILSRLGQRLDVLSGGPRDAPARLRTMRDAIGWSYDLLDGRERAQFRRLSVFAGGASLPAVLWVSSAVDENAGGYPGWAPVSAAGCLALPDSLIALVDQSLLWQEEGVDGEPRFFMLETVRAYACERLQESDEADAIHGRHLAWLLAFAKATAPGLSRTAQAAEVDRLADEIANVRAALTWALAHERPGLALQLALATFQLWFLRAPPDEGQRWLEEALAAAPRVPASERADGLLGASALALLQGNLARHATLAAEGLTVASAAGYQFGTAVALFQLGVAAEWQREPDRAATHYAEALHLSRVLGEPYWVALLLSSLGDVNLWRGRLDEARALATEGLALWQDMDNEWGIAQGLGAVAAVAAEQGDRNLAAQYYRQSLAHSLSLEDWRGITGSLAGLASLAEAASDPRLAARLLGAARALGGAAGVRTMAHHFQFERAVIATRAQLDELIFHQEWALGAGFSMQQAIAAARDVAEDLLA